MPRTRPGRRGPAVNDPVRRAAAGALPGTDVVVVLVTGPDPATLEAISRRIVGERLAACVNLIPGVRSVYRWEGDVHQDAETLAVVKTTRSALEPLRERILELHPYDVPEFLALPVEAGSEGYVAWIDACVSGDPEDREADGEA